MQLYRTIGEPPPLWLTDALARTTHLLSALVEPVSGSGPFFGHDDGARLLPLSERPHRDLAEEDAALAGAVLIGKLKSTDQHSEGCAWFGPADAPPVQDYEASFANLFPQMGVHVLGVGELRAYVRAGQYKFRPAQDDMLHCDIWMHGVNIAPDSSTASYHPHEGTPGMLDSSEHHNGPRIPDRPLMHRASTFLVDELGRRKGRERAKSGEPRCAWPLLGQGRQRRSLPVGEPHG